MSKLNKALEFIASHGDSAFSSELQEGIFSNILSAGVEGLKGIGSGIVDAGVNQLASIQGVGNILASGAQRARGTFALKQEQDARMKRYVEHVGKTRESLINAIKEEEQNLTDLKTALSSATTPEEKKQITDSIKIAQKKLNRMRSLSIDYELTGKGLKVVGGPGAKARRLFGGSVGSVGSPGGTTTRLTP
jgi:hypothetical protein